MEIVWDEAGDRLPLLGGVQDVSTRKVTDKVARLREIGYRHFVVTPTYYIAAKSAEEQLRLFAACRDEAGDMEMIGYNIPQCTVASVAVETFCEAARRGWMRHCKESSGDLKFLSRLVTEGAKVGLRVLMGDEINAAEGLRLGAVGLVNLCSNLEPETYLRLCDAVARGDTAETHRAQQRINRISDEVVGSGVCFVSGPKYLLSKLGIGRGTPVSPLEPVGAAQAARIERFMATAAV
jgi:4-hydroxy-tetrahydrodipicolinate synthase